jgi:segregation and condensation protein B
MDAVEIKIFVEAALLAAGRPLSAEQLQGLFDGRMTPEKAEIRTAIAALNDDYKDRGIFVAEVASGFRVQLKPTMTDQLQKLWEERPPRYSRALFETLALVAYRQPITRGEIEEIRGVSVSANIVRSLHERDWVRVVGHRDVPGRPEMFGTTKAFLDYFGLKKLEDLPPLADLADWENLRVQLDLPEVGEDSAAESPQLADLSVVPSEIRAVEISIAPISDGSDDDIDSDGDVGQGSESAAPPNAPDANLDELVATDWPDPEGSEGDDNTEVTGDDEHPGASASSG